MLNYEVPKHPRHSSSYQNDKHTVERLQLTKAWQPHSQSVRMGNVGITGNKTMDLSKAFTIQGIQTQSAV